MGLGYQTFEVGPNDVEVEEGKRVTIRMSFPPLGWFYEGAEFVLDEKVVDVIVQRWLDLPKGTTRGELIDGVLEGYEGPHGDEGEEDDDDSN